MNTPKREIGLKHKCTSSAGSTAIRDARGLTLRRTSRNLYTYATWGAVLYSTSVISLGEVIGQACRKNFDRHGAIQASVAGAVHFPHAAFTKRSEDLIRSQASSSNETHDGNYFTLSGREVGFGENDVIRILTAVKERKAFRYWQRPGLGFGMNAWIK